MALVAGVVLIIIGLFFFATGLRAFPVGTYRYPYLRPTSWGDIVICWGIAAGLAWGGVGLTAW